VQIYQLKLVLVDHSPQIWRRLLVGADTCLALVHRIFQIALDWEDCHFYRFWIHGKEFGSPQPGGMIRSDDCEQVRLRECRLRVGGRFLYEYTFCKDDFSDCWQCEVRLEAILPAQPDQVHPVCSAGKHACPPEECGGVQNILAYRGLLLETEEQDLQVLTEFAVQVAQRSPDAPALGFAQDSEEYAALALAVKRTEARARLADRRFDRDEINRQLRALPQGCEVGDAIAEPGRV
jgi:hypothetical protein